jgi:ribosomal protein S27E
MGQIFISHSREDEDFKTYLNKAFAVSKVRAVYEEYESIISGDITVQKIIEDITSSDALFVILSKTIERIQYTREWIAFEAAFAYATGKDVWIFEPADQFGQFTFVTPGVSHYAPIYYDDGSFAKLKSIIDSYADKKSSIQRPKGYFGECPKCHSKYTVHWQPCAYFRCPVCNTSIFIRIEGEVVSFGSTFVEPQKRLFRYDPKTNTMQK